MYANTSVFLMQWNLDIIQRVERETSNLPELRDFTDDNRLLLTSERRPGVMRFLKLTPRRPTLRR